MQAKPKNPIFVITKSNNMTTIELNIGLLENTGKELNTHFTKDLVEFTLKKQYTVYDLQTRVKHSTTENTLIVKFKSMASPKYVVKAVKFLADALLQDCIAMKAEGKGQLVYSEYPKNNWGAYSDELFINY